MVGLVGSNDNSLVAQHLRVELATLHLESRPIRGAPSSSEVEIAQTLKEQKLLALLWIESSQKVVIWVNSPQGVITSSVQTTDTARVLALQAAESLRASLRALTPTSDLNDTKLREVKSIPSKTSQPQTVKERTDAFAGYERWQLGVEGAILYSPGGLHAFAALQPRLSLYPWKHVGVGIFGSFPLHASQVRNEMGKASVLPYLGAIELKWRPLMSGKIWRIEAGLGMGAIALHMRGQDSEGLAGATDWATAPAVLTSVSLRALLGENWSLQMRVIVASALVPLEVLFVESKAASWGVPLGSASWGFAYSFDG